MTPNVRPAFGPLFAVTGSKLRCCLGSFFGHARPPDTPPVAGGISPPRFVVTAEQEYANQGFVIVEWPKCGRCHHFASHSQLQQSRQDGSRSQRCTATGPANEVSPRHWLIRHKRIKKIHSSPFGVVNNGNCNARHIQRIPRESPHYPATPIRHR